MYKTFGEHIRNPYYYRFGTGYHDIRKINGFESQPLFDNWTVDWEIADGVIWVSNLDVAMANKISITDYLLNIPPNMVVALVVPHDQFDYETHLRPVLEFQREYYLKNNRYRNQFAIDLTHKVDEAFKEEFKDIASYSHDPIFWLTLDILDNFDAKVKNISIDADKKINKHFLSLNNRASWDRQSLVYLIEKFNLKDKTYLSYQCQNSSRDGYIDQFDQLNTVIGDVWYSSDLEIEKIKSQLPIILDSLSASRNDNVGDTYYDSSFCSIVMETFQRPDNDPINTEKIVKAIAHGHPFLLYGSDGHLQLLRELGFETFSDVFDESYDLITNPSARLEAIFREIIRISNWTLEECESVHKKLKPRLEYNRNHLSTIKNNAPQVIKAHTDLANYDWRVGYNRLDKPLHSIV